MIRSIMVALAASLLLVCAAPSAVRAETVHGTWVLTREGGELVMETHWRSDDGSHNQSNGKRVDANALGITQALNSSGGHATFSMHRDAGDYSFDGWLGNGQGAGNYTFTPNAAFLDALAKRGYVSRGIWDDMALANVDVTMAYLSSLERLGYKTDMRGLIELAALNVTPDYISQMRAAGITADDAHTLVEMKAVGVTPDYVRQMHQAGLNDLSRHSIVELRALGVTSSYIADLAAAGYPHLTAHEYTEMKALGVDANYVRYLNKHGFNNLSVHKIVEFKSLGVEL